MDAFELWLRLPVSCLIDAGIDREPQSVLIKAAWPKDRSSLKGFRAPMRRSAHKQTLFSDAEFTRSILESSHDCIVVLDLEGNNLSVSPGGIEAMEIEDVESIIGLSWLRNWRDGDLQAAKEAIAEARAGRIGRFSGCCPTKKGKPKWWDVMVSSLPDADGKPERLVSVGRDITERRNIEEKLKRSEQRLNLALNASGLIGTWTWDIANNMLYGDENFARLYGIDPELAARGATPQECSKYYHPDDDAIDAALGRLRDGDDDLARERRIVLPDGSLRWLWAKGQITRDAGGVATYWTGASVDITALKQAQEQQKLLMDELSHRVKNTLAVVQAIASQTFRAAASKEDANEALSARLVALAKAQDVLLQGNGNKSNLRTLVRAALFLHSEEQEGRFSIEGPEIEIGPQASLYVALALHELGTNAIKYGALAQATGRVAVVWRVCPTDGVPNLHLRWQESDGPPVVPTDRKGFGSRLIERSLAGALRAAVKLDFLPTGVVLTLKVPVTNLHV
jgi:PAS domain S-box-containing protein